MTRVLIASYRDAENKKYKLYKEHEEADLWTVLTGKIVLFQGTGDELTAYCDGAGLEFERKAENWTAPEEAVEAVEEVSVPLKPEDSEEPSEEVTESIPEDVPDAEIEPAVETIVEAETVEEKVEEAVEEAVEAEPEPPDALADLDAEIAALKAKKAEMEK